MLEVENLVSYEKETSPNIDPPIGSPIGYRFTCKS